MVKKHYWKLEYSISLFVMLGVILLIMPFSIENTRQANFISKWNETYNRIEYMFSVINAHISDDMIKSFNKANTPDEREKLLLTIVKPYLRINTSNYPIRHYRPRYINGSRVYRGQRYFFDDFYFAENNTIVGIKDIKSDKADDVFFLMMFDINGLLPPNRWGKDNLKIECILTPGHTSGGMCFLINDSLFSGDTLFQVGIGRTDFPTGNMNDLKKDCSEAGTGISCSYYYKIGGGFDD